MNNDTDAINSISHARIMEKIKSMQEREDFMLMLAHDMKNPLTIAIASIDRIRKGCLGSFTTEQAEYLQTAFDSSNEVVAMIENLVDIGKLESGKIQTPLHPYNANELVNRVTSQFARAAKNDCIELVVDLAPRTSEIMVDKNSFIRVIGNLLGNSLKFTPEGGSITVSTRRISSVDVPKHVSLPLNLQKKNGFIRVSIKDSGPGIPPEDLVRIFDRYSQLPQNTYREHSGAGLGLAYCKLAIESFHGNIWAESTPEQGSEFIILLPRSPQSNNN